MFTFTQLASRNISGKGTLQVPTGFQRERLYILYADVVRQPKNKYANFAYNPARGRYASLVFMRAGYVQKVEPMEFPRQEYRFVNDVSGQQLNALKCAYAGVLQSFVNLGIKLNLILPTVENTIKEYSNIDLIWDEVKVVCYADTGIKLTLKSANYELCDDEFEGQPPPDEPPDEPTPVTPGEPFDVSPPYSFPTDDGDTLPYPGDSPPPASYTIKVVGSSYGGGCIVFPEDDIYVTLTDVGSGNYGIVNRGASAQCGGFDFWVKDLTQDRIIYTNTSPGKNLHLEVTANP